MPLAWLAEAADWPSTGSFALALLHFSIRPDFSGEVTVTAQLQASAPDHAFASNAVTVQFLPDEIFGDGFEVSPGS